MDQAQQKWQFDWKQVGDYLLGRSTLIGIASMMLLTISAYATWHGLTQPRPTAEVPPRCLKWPPNMNHVGGTGR